MLDRRRRVAAPSPPRAAAASAGDLCGRFAAIIGRTGLPLALGCSVLIVVSALFTPNALAEPPLQLPPLADSQLHAAAPVFDYSTPTGPDYVRAALDEAAFLGIGFSEYVWHHDLNSQDWDFSYDWSGLRRKLGPQGYSFDTNGFDTNFIRHPAAGIMYYWAARSNRLTIFESAAISTAASLIWEYLGELRERASINDLIVTPLAGVVLGEVTLQLGAFFDRSCDTVPNRILGSVLGPMKSLHDLIDGAKLRRETQCDALGFTQRGAHSFRLSLGVGTLASVRGPEAAPLFATQLDMHTRVVAVHSFGSEGEGTTTFADGNVTEFWLSTLLGANTWVDFSLRGMLMPIGLHYRDLRAGRGGLHGYELLFGLLLGTEYTVHRFAWAQADARQRDRFFELDVPGVGLVYRRAMGPWSLTLELQTAVALLGIDALAKAAYLSRASGDALPTVARNEDYNYLVGLRVSPRAWLSWRAFELGVDVSAVRGTVVTVRDRYGEHVDYVSGSELRTLGDVWLSWGPSAWPLRFRVAGSLLERVGVIDTTRSARMELRVLAGIGANL